MEPIIVLMLWALGLATATVFVIDCWNPTLPPLRSLWIVLHVAGVVMSVYGLAVAAWVVADGGYTHSLGLAAAVMVAGVVYCVETIRHGVD